MSVLKGEVILNNFNWEYDGKTQESGRRQPVLLLANSYLRPQVEPGQGCHHPRDRDVRPVLQRVLQRHLLAPLPLDARQDEAGH